MNRRNCLRTTALLAATAFVGRPSCLFGADTIGPSHEIAGRTLTLSQAQVIVLGFVRAYSSDLYIHGSGLVAQFQGGVPDCTRIVASIGDLRLFSDCMTGHGAVLGTKLHASGNLMSFVLAGESFEIESVLPVHFSARTAAIAGAVAPAEALLYQPLTKAVTDPHGILAAQGGTPMDTDAALSAAHATPDTEMIGGKRFLTLNYRRDLTQPGLIYQAECSESLQDGSWTTHGVIDEVLESTATSETRRARIPVSGRCQFLRLRILKN